MGIGIPSNEWFSAEIYMATMRKIPLVVLVVSGVAVLSFECGGWQARMKEWHRCQLSECRFAQLALALRNYHDQYGAFPPTRYQTRANAPIHSWRVLLLPYGDMYTRDLFFRYNFSEDWNSPGNLAVARAVSSWMPVFSIDNNDVANYLAIGEGDEWPSDAPLRARLITVGRDHFLLFEYPDSDIFWTEPKY